MLNFKIETINKLMDELDTLRSGCRLLEDVYLEYGPYGDGEISDELRRKINNFFKFDDSE